MFAAIEESVKPSRSDVPIGLTLSAGLDSSILKYAKDRTDLSSTVYRILLLIKRRMA